MASPRYTSQSRSRRSNKQMRIVIMAIVLIIAFVIKAYDSLSESQSASNNIPKADYTYVEAPTDHNRQIIEYEAMTVAFNSDLHIPDWVAWELTYDEADGSVPRKDDFEVAENVEGCALPSDYYKSGYDRGHMAPAGDMKWSETAMEQSFILTNIAPQAGELNSGAWKKLEEKCRARVTLTNNGEQRDSAIVIICGPVPGEKPIGYIGESSVAVPQRFFKVILAPYAREPYSIGFVMPNGKVEGGMQKAAMSVDDVETITGYDFFSALPDSIENQIESHFNFNKWSTLH